MEEIAVSAALTPLPEPGTATLAATGVIGLALLQRAKRRGRIAEASSPRSVVQR